MPVELRAHLPPVEGFATKPGRTEFSKPLGTEKKAIANQKAAPLDALVEAAFATARASLVQAPPPVLQAPSPTIPPLPVDPRAAFLALERWEAKAIRAAEVRFFNMAPDVRRGISEEAAKRSDLMVALGKRPMWLTEEWRRIEGFDAALAAALQSEGIAATSDHPSLARLRDDFAARWANLLSAEGKMETGFWEWTFDEEQVAAPAAADARPSAASSSTTSGSSNGGMTIRAMFDDYLRELRHTDAPEKTAFDINRVLDRFVEFAGPETTARSVSASQVRDFRDLALRLPARPTHQNRALPIGALAARYADQPDTIYLSRRTVAKWLDFLHAAFEHGVTQEYLDTNPISRAKFRRSRSTAPEPRVQFSEDDLIRIFCSPLFRGCQGEAREHIAGPIVSWNAKYWVPLLAAQSGARINELGQLRVSDVCFEQDINYLNITVDDENQDIESDHNEEISVPRKRVKTAASKRKVPIHTRIIELGFLDYVEACRTVGSPYLFPELDHQSRFGPTKNLSRWFGRYLDRIGIVDRRKVFHSFRHNIKHELREKPDNNRDIADRLTGSAPSDTSGRYGSAPRLRVLQNLVNRIDLSFLSHLERPVQPSLLTLRVDGYRKDRRRR